VNLSLQIVQELLNYAPSHFTQNSLSLLLNYVPHGMILGILVLSSGECVLLKPEQLGCLLHMLCYFYGGYYYYYLFWFKNGG
jgi:hypothetical protein